MRRLTFPWICFLSCFVFISDSGAQEPVDLTATVVAWNIEGNRGGPLGSGISADRAKEIAKGMTYLDAEVFLLTEVKQPDILDDIITELSNFGASYTKKTENQASNLHISIIHKVGTSVTDVKLVPGTDAGDTDNRKALSAKVKIGNFDFIMIGLHLKSSRSNSDRGIRNMQAKSIATYIRNETSGAEKDVVVLGDYNMIPDPNHPSHDLENFDTLNVDDFLFFVSSMDLLGQGTHIRNGRIGNLLDGFAISNDHTDEYIEGSLRIFPLHRTMRKDLRMFSRDVSDHLPLVARFDIAVADDD
jgi:endonuclease/exonuclease/phosphatase family metal-dependent hydrolase